MLAPIALFVYNRPWHTIQTVESLSRNILAKESELFIFSDGAKQPSDEQDVRIVRDYIHNINGFRNVFITERSANLGLANSVINGVTEIIVKCDRVIVLEDDIITSSTFLTFMNECLNFYQDYLRIGSVTGYSLPIELSPDYPWSVYLTHRHSSWGWGTYQRVWKDIDWEVRDYNSFRRDRSARRAFNVAGPDMAAMLDSQMVSNIDSWSIRLDYNCFKMQLLSLAPVNNLVKNIGFDGSGVHCDASNKCLEGFLSEENKEKSFLFPKNPELDPHIVTATRKLFKYSLATRLKRRIKSLYNYLPVK